MTASSSAERHRHRTIDEDVKSDIQRESLSTEQIMRIVNISAAQHREEQRVFMTQLLAGIQNLVGNANRNQVPIPPPHQVPVDHNEMTGVTAAEVLRICDEAMGTDARRTARPINTKPYPNRVLDRLYPRGFKFPDFPQFDGESHQSTIAHIARFTARCAEHSSDGDLKMKWFENSLTGLAHTWFINLAPNALQTREDMERAFHEQFYRAEPEVTIADLAKMSQGTHESAQDFLGRFKTARNKCRINLGEQEFVRLAQQGLSYELRKKYEGVDFCDIFDLTTSVARYEAIVKEETEKRTASKGTYYKNPAVLALEAEHVASPSGFFGWSPKDDSSAEVNVAELSVNKPVVCKDLSKAQPAKTTNIQANDGMAFKTAPARTYTFDITKADQIFDQLLAEKLVKLPTCQVIPKAEELKDKNYCKYHNSWKHSTNPRWPTP